ncbi:unnamed protein product [Owenia fusiformis]|uniref:Uncharacterized protein n=1 Tax=Owenia fusiformis TaxID=6347 RepID=A0A8J1UFU9_OWEFU|nr:unnamed protein product [Owenia fusiformis]
MVARKVPKEVQQIFDRYIKNNVRRLKKADAIIMLNKEFELSEEQANVMFDTFDKDKNGIMSIWEFHQFYQTVGASAHEMVEKFKEMDKDGSGQLDADEAREGLRSIKVADGRPLAEKEIEFFIKSTAGEDNVIDIGEFASLLFRLKLCKK